VMLEDGYSSRVSNEGLKSVKDMCPQQQERHGRQLSFYGLTEWSRLKVINTKQKLAGLKHGVRVINQT